jgi:sugar transferase (PEP-CTERM/EpsH1 system associated)
MEKGIATLINHGAPEIAHTILCLTASGASQRLLSRPVAIVALNKPEGNSLKFIKNLAKTLRELKPDVVHTRNWSGLDGVIAARLAGIKGIVHGEHGWGLEDIDGRKFKRVIIRRLLSLWIKEFTCVSQQMVGWLNSEIGVPKNRITQVYNGVDCDLFQPAAVSVKQRVRAELGIASNQPLVGIIGRLDPIKDHATLFAAFSMVRCEMPQATLLVVGDGPHRKALEKQAVKGIHFLGNRPDVAQILAALDVFVLSSLNEGISNTILEAMATALPVVATNVGGTPELIENGRTGIMVPARTPPSLAYAILSYLKDEALRRCHGLAAREAVLKKYSINHMVSEYESVWKRVALQKGVQRTEKIELRR